LLQKQSHTTNDLTRIYASTLAIRNGANTATAASFGGDKAYVIMGRNSGKRCSTAASNTELPGGCGLYSRIEREWRVQNTNYTGTFSCDFALHNCADLGSVNAAHLRLLVDDDGDFSNGGTSCYFNGDGTGIVITYANPTITVSNISGIHLPSNSTGFITVGSINSITPLPAELLEFAAIPVNNSRVRLDWSTSTEINNDYFTVEKSIDGLNWQELGLVEGAGNSYTILSYREWDEDPHSGVSYYRLKQTDFDGTYSYSEIRAVNFKITVNPNPTSGEMYIVMNGSEFRWVKMISALGQDVTPTYEVDQFLNLKMDASHLARGIYYVLINTRGKVEHVKVVLN